jgi:hypothetical protein
MQCEVTFATEALAKAHVDESVGISPSLAMFRLKITTADQIQYAKAFSQL